MRLFDFKQTTPSSTWNIVHNLQSNVVGEIRIWHEGQLRVITPQVFEIVDENTVNIGFSSPQTGSVRLMGNWRFVQGDAV